MSGPEFIAESAAPIANVTRIERGLFSRMYDSERAILMSIQMGRADVASAAEGMIAILLPGEADAVTGDHLADLAQALGARAYCGLSFRRRPDEHVRLHDRDRLATGFGVHA